MTAKPTSPDTAILWFRQDLRLSDNPALHAAIKEGSLLPIYIIPKETGCWTNDLGGASKWWLFHSLNALNQSLKGHLHIYYGDFETVLNDLIQRCQAKSIFWNRVYEPHRIQCDTRIKKIFREQGLICQSFNGSLLWEPWDVMKSDGSPYKVFTPYFKNGCLKANAPRTPFPSPDLTPIQWTDDRTFCLSKDAIKDLLIPTIPWYESMEAAWQNPAHDLTIGEKGAHNRLQKFLHHKLNGYKEKRDFPALAHVSQLSPHLHFGEISPHQVWHGLMGHLSIHHDDHIPSEDIYHFQSELGWREFSYALLYHFPATPLKNFQPKYDAFPWRDLHDPKIHADLVAWQTGQTGYPIVDAGMRELWQTGYMHNRVRMIVASFLVKNLLIHWHHGAKWFMDCLLDADLANNTAGWQWVAGSGADAAPYFRIFNPVSQGEKFDPKGDYIKQFVPELANLPAPYLFAPWTVPDVILNRFNVQLGITYPKPIVDLNISRKRALDALKSL